MVNWGFGVNLAMIIDVSWNTGCHKKWVFVLMGDGAARHDTALYCWEPRLDPSKQKNLTSFFPVQILLGHLVHTWFLYDFFIRNELGNCGPSFAISASAHRFNIESRRELCFFDWIHSGYIGSGWVRTDNATVEGVGGYGSRCSRGPWNTWRWFR